MVSVSSSPSFKRSHHKSNLSLTSLPEDLLVEISTRVAASSSLPEINSLQLVSKSFKSLYNNPYVVRRLSFHYFSWSDIPIRQKLSKYFDIYLQNGDPEALYLKGLHDYFHQDSDVQRRLRGIENLAKAARKQNQEAQYVYGMILICLGGRTQQKGFKILSSLIKPSMSSTMKETEKIRNKIRDYGIMWSGIAMMRKLKRDYVCERCDCDGQIEKFFAKIPKTPTWTNEYEDNDLVTSSACEICLWHHEVELFFDDV